MEHSAACTYEAMNKRFSLKTGAGHLLRLSLGLLHERGRNRLVWLVWRWRLVFLGRSLLRFVARWRRQFGPE